MVKLFLCFFTLVNVIDGVCLADTKMYKKIQ